MFLSSVLLSVSFHAFKLGSHCRTEHLTAGVQCVPVHRFRSDFSVNFWLKRTRRRTGLLCNSHRSHSGDVRAGHKLLTCELDAEEIRIQFAIVCTQPKGFRKYIGH
ncbi:hypothetical protein AB205_0167750 [Aquarana catesbeiana]|uniref:Secreted protein n=1 Tax=Aquarana catesbeiana TaxID=8400 RepID=A0A2G9QBR4_AQUCT|nr:hypothetical protein AB205_0167750 [Aquarana catesbeiana]